MFDLNVLKSIKCNIQYVEWENDVHEIIHKDTKYTNTPLINRAVTRKNSKINAKVALLYLH